MTKPAITFEHAQQLAAKIGEHQRFFYGLQRRMIEWGFPTTDETLAMVSHVDDLLGELRSQMFFLGYDADEDCWR
jgi:hypothetical protein